MSNDDSDITFNGTDGSEAERFVTAIRRKALTLDKQSDNAWIAAYAASCLEGPAVRWFESLDDEIQDDWKLLRRALLKKWPATIEIEHTQVEPRLDWNEVYQNIMDGSRVPTPAAAPPPPAAAPPPPVPPKQTAAARRGRIRVVADFPTGSGYVGRTLDGWGHYGKCGPTATSEALIVEYTASSSPPYGIFVDAAAGKRLGVTWPSLTSTDWTSGAVRRAKLVTVTQDAYGRIGSSSRADLGATQYLVWTVDAQSYMNVTYLEDNGTPRVLECVMQDHKNPRHSEQSLRLVVSAKQFAKAEGNCCRAHLVFEPL